MVQTNHREVSQFVQRHRHRHRRAQVTPRHHLTTHTQPYTQPYTQPGSGHPETSPDDTHTAIHTHTEVQTSYSAVLCRTHTYIPTGCAKTVDAFLVRSSVLIAIGRQCQCQCQVARLLMAADVTLADPVSWWVKNDGFESRLFNYSCIC